MQRRTRTVEDVMTTALLTVTPEDPVDCVEFDMKRADIRHLPVVGPGNRLVGIVSDRDLLRAMADRSAALVADIMTRNVATVQASDAASRALDVLLDRKIGCVPVLGDDRQLVGIVTETDFLRIAREALRP